MLTEAGTKRRASLHLVSGRDALKAFDRGRVNVLRSTPEEFAVALRSRNRTLKRALTDPVITDGIGNTYSDEILHRARFSPFKLTETLTDEDISRLHQAAVDVLTEWIDRLRQKPGPGSREGHSLQTGDGSARPVWTAMSSMWCKDPT